MFNYTKNDYNEKTAKALYDTKLSEYDIISDVLMGQKQLIKQYATAVCEVSTDTLRAVLEDNLKECAIDQFDSFLFMNARGMYPTTEAETKQLTQTRDKWNKDKAELSL